jgi:hypothetical protein
MDMINATAMIAGTKIKPAGYYVREGSYWPEWLGLNLKGVEWIHVGYCPHPMVLNMTPAVKRFENNFAHAHPLEKAICFSSGTFIFEKPGVVSDTLIHEYCHILRGATPEEIMTKNLHDEEWGELMMMFGLEPCEYAMTVFR